MDQETLKFVGPEGNRLRADQTPEDAALEEGNEIQVFIQQVSGSTSGCVWQ